MANGSQIPGEYWDLKTGSQRCKVSIRTLKRWIASGLKYRQPIPHGKILLSPADIEQFLTLRQHPAPALDKLVDDVMQELQQSAKS